MLMVALGGGGLTLHSQHSWDVEELAAWRPISPYQMPALSVFRGRFAPWGVGMDPVGRGRAKIRFSWLRSRRASCTTRERILHVACLRVHLFRSEICVKLAVSVFPTQSYPWQVYIGHRLFWAPLIK